MNKDGAMTHLKILKLLYDMEASRSTIRRIIDPLNKMESTEDLIVREKELLKMLEGCKDEQEVLLRLKNEYELTSDAQEG